MGDLIKRQWILPFYWMIRVWRGMFLCFVPIQFINIIAVSKFFLLSLTADLVLLYILLLISFYLFFIMFNLIRGRLFNLQGGVMVFCFVQKFFFGQHESLNIFFFLPEFNIKVIWQILWIRLFFFPPPKSEYFFQQHWESEYCLLEIICKTFHDDDNSWSFYDRHIKWLIFYSIFYILFSYISGVAS